jgi:hypothetical protein
LTTKEKCRENCDLTVYLPCLIKVGKVKVDIKTSPQDICFTPPGALQQQKLQIFAAESQELSSRCSLPHKVED